MEATGWTGAQRPPRDPMAGRTCLVEPLEPERHAAQLHAANMLDRTHRNWTYLPYGPFQTFGEYLSWLNGIATTARIRMFHAIVDGRTNEAVGLASYLRT